MVDEEDDADCGGGNGEREAEERRPDGEGDGDGELRRDMDCNLSKACGRQIYQIEAFAVKHDYRGA